MNLTLFSGLQFIGIVLGFLLFKTLLKQNEKNKEASRILAYFNLLIAVTLIGRFLISFFSVPQVIGYTADIIIFCFGPLIYFFVRSFFKRPFPKVKIYWHFLPAINHLLAMIVLFSQNMSNSFSELPTIDKTNILSYGYYAELVAIIHIQTYLALCFKEIAIYAKKQRNELSFNQVPNVFLILMTLIQLAILLWASGYFSRLFHQSFTQLSYHLTWLILPLITLVITNTFLSRDEMFILSNTKLTNTIEPALRPINEKLIQLLENEKIYMQPKLTLADISKKLHTNQTTLSRTINTLHKQNFFEFINNYRINEFVARANQSEYKSMTFIAIASDVGFSSKATFYSCFRKKFGTTPKEYFKTVVG